jgi:methylmalonyl-CoA/ethylmalonyl-CoA epimerase
MYTLEHIGIAVQSLAKSDPLFEFLLKAAPYKHESVPDQGVITSFFRSGVAKVELLEPTHADSPIQKFIDKRGEGIHHIAFEVSDIRKEMKRLREAGFDVLADKPSIGADRKWVCFIHPRSTNGVLVELCQSMTDSDLGMEDPADE